MQNNEDFAIGTSQTRISRREIIRRASLASAGIALIGIGCNTKQTEQGEKNMQNQNATVAPNAASQANTYPFQLPALPYAFDALEPVIDAQTMQLHHDKHHQTYVDKLNEALKDQTDLQGKTLEQLLQGINEVPEAVRTAVRNHGGGHYNHSLFWNIMKRNEGKAPTGATLKTIEDSFGTFDDFKTKFNDAGAKLFGSGWVFVVMDGGKLKIQPMPNQDSPVMNKQQVVFGNDVWEHAYYLKYQ
ncbi:MAG: superoxide dismutase, partial [Pyrinomonadaceae bacterium]